MGPLGTARRRTWGTVTTPGFIRDDAMDELIESLRTENRLLVERVVELTRERDQLSDAIWKLQQQPRKE